jgi:hypothetical protein
VGWENCRGKRYYVIREQINGKKIRRSAGSGERGLVAEQVHKAQQAQIRQEKQDAKALHLLSREYEALVNIAVAETLQSLGFQKRNCRWVRPRFQPTTLPAVSLETERLDALDAEIRRQSLAYFNLAEAEPKSNLSRELVLEELHQLQASLQKEHDHPIERIVQRQFATFWLQNAVAELKLIQDTDPLRRIKSPHFWITNQDHANNQMMRVLALLPRLKGYNLGSYLPLQDR